MISLVIMDPVEGPDRATSAKLGTRPHRRQGPRARRLAAWALLAGVALQVALVFLWVRPGPLSIDEVIYQWMAHDVAAGRLLTLDNGFELGPSAELATFYMVASGDRLLAQYPYGFPYLAAPAVAAFRLRGLFLVNALSFVAALALVAHIGMRLLRDRAAVTLGLAVLVGATFAWEYSMAAWPHALALVAQLGAFALLLAALDAEPPRRRLVLAAGAGLVTGIGATLRLDGIFLLAALALPFLLATPIRARELSALVVGTVPALAFLSGTNWLRWGNPSPFSYGLAGGVGELRRYAPLVAAGTIALIALVALTRPAVRARLSGRATAVWLGALAAAVLVLLVPWSRALALRLVRGLYALVVDLRGQPANYADGQRVGDFAMIYGNGIKKALLQSCPWLPLVALPYLLRPRDAADRRALLLLALVPGVLVPVYSFFSWHGGLGLNLRYFLPALPFLALLAGRALRELARGLSRSELRASAAAGLVAVAAYALLAAPRPLDAPGERAPFVLDVPLGIAAVTAGLVALIWARGRTGATAAPPTGVRRALLAASAVGMGWAGALAFEYDAAWSRGMRDYNLNQSAVVAPHLADGSLLFGYYPDYFATVRNLRPEVTVAFPRQDAFADFHPLATRWLDAGRPVFAVLTAGDWSYMRAQGHLDGLEFRVAAAGQPFPLMQVRRIAVDER